MEVVEYARNRSFGVVIREGDAETRGRATFENAGGGRTKLTVVVDIPMDESMRDTMAGLIQRSLGNIKKLVEDEYGDH